MCYLILTSWYCLQIQDKNNLCLGGEYLPLVCRHFYKSNIITPILAGTGNTIDSNKKKSEVKESRMQQSVSIIIRNNNHDK